MFTVARSLGRFAGTRKSSNIGKSALVAGIALATALTSGAAQAHDFWIEPSSFAPATGELVRVHLRVGHAPNGELVVRDAARIAFFIMLAPAGRSDVVGIDGHDPAGIARVTEPGGHLIGYQSNPKPIELAPRQFESYLREEGLERIIADRTARAESNRPGRERYARSAKALLPVGGSAGGFDRRLGLTLELVPLDDPFAPGLVTCEFQLRYRDEPCPHVQVAAIQGDQRALTLARTNEEGNIRVELAGDGVCILKAVHMVRAPADLDYEWESFWASLILQRGALKQDRVQTTERDAISPHLLPSAPMPSSDGDSGDAP